MIKHLNIVYDQDSAQEPNTVPVSAVDNVINGSVQNISCTCLDKLEYDNRKQFVIKLIHKIAMNGSLSLQFLNLDILGNKIKKKELNGKKFSDIIANTRSIWDHAESVEFLSSIGKEIVIESLGFDNTNTVVQLKKT